jgi:septum formation protein
MSSDPEIILASTSPYRRQLLERLGVPFRSVPPRFDESTYPGEGLDPVTLAESLAYRKASSIVSEFPRAVIIGSDQLVSLDETIYGKPGILEKAIDQLVSMSGRTHRLITALVVLHRGMTMRHVDVTTLQMRSLDRTAIRRYLERDQPYDCAGSYKLESGGIALFERIETADHTAITGLPLIALTSVLRRIGYSIP